MSTYRDKRIVIKTDTNTHLANINTNRQTSVVQRDVQVVPDRSPQVNTLRQTLLITRTFASRTFTQCRRVSCTRETPQSTTPPRPNSSVANPSNNSSNNNNNNNNNNNSSPTLPLVPTLFRGTLSTPSPAVRWTPPWSPTFRTNRILVLRRRSTSTSRCPTSSASTPSPLPSVSTTRRETTPDAFTRRLVSPPGNPLLPPPPWSRRVCSNTIAVRRTPVRNLVIRSRQTMLHGY